MLTVRRKSLLYKTKVEYGDYTINHVEGCSHGCLYPCYALLLAKRYGRVKSYDEWREPKLVSNTMELLEREIPLLKDKIGSVHLSFTTDPFMMAQPEVVETTLKIIDRLNRSGIKVTTLTKGVYPDDLAKNGFAESNEYGITLVSLDEEFRKQYEPYAAPYEDRIGSLRALHDAGLRTWVSIEPYPSPNIVEQSLENILESVSFVDKVIFGKLNYNPRVAEYRQGKEFYNRCSSLVRNFCSKRGLQWYIKRGTDTVPRDATATDLLHESLK
jgi:DNA repair photolyase